MNLYPTIKKTNYRFWFVFVFMIAILSGIIIERIMFQLSSASWEKTINQYHSLICENTLEKIDVLRYLLKHDMKKQMVLLVLCFSVAGFPCTAYFFYSTIYHDIFFLMAMYRCGIGSKYIICITTIVIGLVFCIPAFWYCMKLSFKSFLYCAENNLKFYRCSKYQLQTEVKIGIIILLYHILGSVVEAMICTDLYVRIFR